MSITAEIVSTTANYISVHERQSRTPDSGHVLQYYMILEAIQQSRQGDVKDHQKGINTRGSYATFFRRYSKAINRDFGFSFPTYSEFSEYLDGEIVPQEQRKPLKLLYQTFLYTRIAQEMGISCDGSDTIAADIYPLFGDFVSEDGFIQPSWDTLATLCMQKIRPHVDRVLRSEKSFSYEAFLYSPGAMPKPLADEDVVCIMQDLEKSRERELPAKPYLDLLIHANEGLVTSIAHTYIELFQNSSLHAYDRTSMAEELSQEGFVALYDAIAKYDVSKNTTFSTYAFFHIRKGVLDYFRSNHHLRIPAQAWQDYNNYLKGAHAFELKYGRKPTLPHVEEVMLLSGERFSHSARAFASYILPALENSSSSLESHEELGGFSQRRVANPVEEIALNHIMSEDIIQSIDSLGLTVKQREALYRYFGLAGHYPKTMEEVGGEMDGITREAVRQLLDKAIKKIERSAPTIRRLYGYYTDGY